MQDKDAESLENVLNKEADFLQKEASADAAKPGKIGLALSGGGIRSATFCLGVLQALAAEKKLASFDYMSTVSGGGYIGSWLSAWIHRAGLETVQKRLGEFGSAEKHGAPAACEPAEVTWLRRYSNYLSPRVGLLSLDSLTLIATWLRNFTLNLIVLLGFMACLFTAPHLLLSVFEIAGAKHAASGFGASWTGLLFCFGIGYNLWHQGLPIGRRRNWLISTRGVMTTVILPGVLASSLAAIWLANGPKTLETAIEVSSFVAVLLSLLLVAWMIAEGGKKQFSSVLKEIPIYVLASMVAILVCVGMVTALYLIWSCFVPHDNETAQLIYLVAFGPPALLAIFGMGTTVFTGLVGRIFFERSREWWSRLNAWLVSLGVGWALLGLLTFFSLPILEWLASKLGGWLSLLGTGWIGSLLTSIFFRKPEFGTKNLQLRVDSALNMAAAVFVAGLLFVVASATQWALLAGGAALSEPLQNIAGHVTTLPEVHDHLDLLSNKVGTLEQHEASIGDRVNAHIDRLYTLYSRPDVVDGLSLPATAMLALLSIMLLFSWRVDINKFSLHNMYKNRLVRCYLGASNQLTRNEQPFTGFDDADDIPLRDLTSVKGDSEKRPLRPLHIINATLNITQGANLAWQERKAASFIFTPLFCGYSLARTQGDSTSIERSSEWTLPGFRPTDEYATGDQEENGFKLGMALATSGAAVSPNMGYASRPARAFVLTMFNIRLGRWSSNPAGAAWRYPGPRFGLITLLQELLGYSNENRNYVYLSDGGHFDNLGLYELVRRRCSVIFIIDAGADPMRTFGNLADTIRKCRIDMGVDISFPELKLLAGDQKMRATQGFTSGVIHYDATDSSKDGKLILIKPSMSRAQLEPIDVLNYAAENPPFPQQTTGDQFFDESQFESYRRLGAFITHRCLERNGNLLPNHTIAAVQLKPLKTDEVPVNATRLVGMMFLRFVKQPLKLPKRDGSLLDFFVILLLITLLFGLAFTLFDPILIGARGKLCFQAATCHGQLTALYETNSSGVLWRSGLLWRTMIDNVFILIYALTFLCGFIVGTQSITKRTLRNWSRVLLLSLPIATACIDYAENFATLGELLSAADTNAKAAVTAPLTAWKFWLFTASLVALLGLTPAIMCAFKGRWASAVYPGVLCRTGKK